MHFSKQSHLLGNKQSNIKPLLHTLPLAIIKILLWSFSSSKHFTSIMFNSFATSYQEAIQDVKGQEIKNGDNDYYTAKSAIKTCCKVTDGFWIFIKKAEKYCLITASCQLHFKTLDVHNSCGYTATDTVPISCIYSCSGRADVLSHSLCPHTHQTSSILKLIGYKWSTSSFLQAGVNLECSWPWDLAERQKFL